MWMFGSRTTVKKVRNSLTWFSHGSGASLAPEPLVRVAFSPDVSKMVKKARSVSFRLLSVCPCLALFACLWFMLSQLSNH